MTLDVQFKLKSNPNYIKYLRNNSYWYKVLNRHPEKFKEFEDAYKEQNRLKTSDRIGKTLEMIELVQNIFTSMR